MIDPEPYRPPERGIRHAFQASRLHAWLVRKGWLDEADDARDNPELAYAFMAQRIVRDWPPPDSGTGQVIALFRACGASMATDCALMLAKALTAESKRNVLLVDADWHDGLLSRRFKREDAPGLCQVLMGDGDPSLAQVRTDTAVPGVEFVPLGNAGLLPEALVEPGLDPLFDAMRGSARHTILMLSPVPDDTRHVPIAMAADIVMIVAEEARTLLPDIEQAEGILATNGVRDPKIMLARHRAAARDTSWQVSS